MPILIRSVLVLLVMLVGVRYLSAADIAPDGDSLKRSAVEHPGPIASPDTDLIEPLRPHHDLMHLRGVSPLVGVLLLGLAVLPLFFGWRLLRLAVAVLAGCFLALVVWQYGMPWLHHLMPQSSQQALTPLLGIAAVIAWVVGVVVGWFLYQAEVAVSAALLGAMVLSLPGMYLDWPLLTTILAVVGLVIGFIAGWAIAPYWAALQTSILGGFLVVQGVAILTQQSLATEQTRMLAYGLGIAAAVIGCIAQMLWIARQDTRADAGGRAAAHGT